MSDMTSVPAKPFEQRLYLRSPFGLLPTTAIIFSVLFGSFVFIALFDHVGIVGPGGFSNAGWPALVVSLLCTAALAMQRYMHIAEAKETANYARILRGGEASALLITFEIPGEARLGRATIVGVLIGIVVSLAIRFTEMREGNIVPPMTMIWFAAASTFLTVLFMRGVEQTRVANTFYSRLLEDELQIDLLRVDSLAVLGRSAARSALIWFVVSAVACLFFVGGDLNWPEVGLVLVCASMGVAIFIAIMGRVHRQMMAAKREELERVRCQIESLRDTMHEDAGAAQRLHGILAYEQRIANTAEWPFDHTTLVRVAASTLILTVPWFGQAVAQYLVDHFAR